MRALFLPLLLLLPMSAAPPKKPRPFAAKVPREKPLVAATRAKAKRGIAKAQFDLGVMYAFGQGVPRSDVDAVLWYRKAAEQDYAKAQYNLGVCCDSGRGLPKDHAEAAAWYRKAAEQGHTKAQFNLGISYKYGQGLEQDSVEAYAWLGLAADAGEAKAAASQYEVALDLTGERLEQGKARQRQLKEELAVHKSKR
jgi:TPR repeat protein